MLQVRQKSVSVWFRCYLHQDPVSSWTFSKWINVTPVTKHESLLVLYKKQIIKNNSTLKNEYENIRFEKTEKKSSIEILENKSFSWQSTANSQFEITCQANNGNSNHNSIKKTQTFSHLFNSFLDETLQTSHCDMLCVDCRALPVEKFASDSVTLFEVIVSFERCWLS